MTDKLNSVFLVWGIRGEYSSRTEWPVAAYTSEPEPQAGPEPQTGADPS